MTRMPSATSAAIWFIRGPRAPTRILGMPHGFGPGSNATVIRVWRVYSPSNANGVPFCQWSRIALVASTHSRIWATGLPQRQQQVVGVLEGERPVDPHPLQRPGPVDRVDHRVRQLDVELERCLSIDHV